MTLRPRTDGRPGRPTEVYTHEPNELTNLAPTSPNTPT